MASEHTETQWRVVGDPNPVYGRNGHIAVEFPHYDFTWTEAVTARHAPGKTPEEAAREFVARMEGRWSAGPELFRRTVVTTEWEPVDAT